MDIHGRIGDYEILNELGRGGMGRVFRVRHVIADRVEAMKVLLPDLAGRQDLAARFLREIKVLAALNHPNIAALRTALTVDNQLVMIMEYVEGQSLAERLTHGPIAAADALSYVDQVLDALAYAHGRGVVHRDVKPANMMLTAAGVVKLTDFGIARSTTDETITVAGTTTGSLSYMAPEQVNGEMTDARSDLYSVGISLYELVTGQRPFRAENDFHVMLAHLKEEPRPPVELQPSLPPALNGIILRSIAKAPAARFQSADEFRQALRATGAGVAGGTSTRQATVPIPTSGQTATMQGASRAHHPLLFVALGAVLVITALVGTGLYLGRAEAGPDRAREAPAAATPAASGAEAAPHAEATAAMSDTALPGPGTVPRSDAPGGVAAAPPSPLTAPPAASGETRAAEPAPVRPPAPVPPSAPRATAGPGQSQPPAAASPAASAPDQPEDALAQPTPPPPAPAADAAALDAIEKELDQLATRAAAVTGSLDRLREQQARQGLGLRGDMVARQESMQVNLSRAQEAVDRGDAARAAKLRDAAGRDIEALERFLGR